MESRLLPENRFDAAADAYVRARPSYPPALVDWVRDEAGLVEGGTALDLGAGTGALTELLAASGLDVIAAEPSAEMRSRLASRLPGVEVLPDTAERLSVPDAGLDLATAANALHWFDVRRAYPEIRRALRPRGHFAVIWQLPDEGDALQARLWALVEELHLGEAEYPGPHPGDPPDWEADFESVATAAFPSVHRLPHDLLPDYVASWSPVANMEAEAERELLDEVRGWSAEPIVELRFRIEAELGRARPT